VYILTLWRSDWSTRTVTPFLPGLDSGASTPISMMQRLSLSSVEGSDCESLDPPAVGKVPPGINRTSKELPLLLLSLLLLSLISVSLLLLLMLLLKMSEYLLLATFDIIFSIPFGNQDRNEKDEFVLGLFWLVLAK